jgi:hypothetical protein
MVFRRAAAIGRRAKDFAGQAYAAAHDLAPGIKKGAEAAKRAYQTAAQSGLIDDLAGKRSAQIHRGARSAMDAYSKFEDAARKADSVARAVQGD